MKTVIRIQDDVTFLPHFCSLKWGRQEGVELALQKSLKSAHNPQEADRLAREIESTDRAIDSLVYELYGLTEEEIGIVEER
jgi:hypothetical protein